MIKDTDARLIDICGKYNLDIELKDNLKTQIHEFMIELFSERCSDKKCAIWGCGQLNEIDGHTAMIIQRYSLYLRGLQCIVDSDYRFQGKTFLEYPVISPEKFIELDIDIVIIGSRSFAQSIKNDLISIKPNCQYIDIYNELAVNGIDCSNRTSVFENNNMYIYLYNIRKDYENETNKLIKSDKLRELIRCYLSIRDFYYTYLFLDEYIKNKYDNYTKMIDFKNELISFVNEVFSKCRNKNNRDIAMFYIDALGAMNVYDEKNDSYRMFSKYMEEAVYFKNAYSTAATTYESRAGFFGGRYPSEDYVYKKYVLDEIDEIPFVYYADLNNYEINMYQSAPDIIKERERRVKFNYKFSLTEKLWDITCDRAEKTHSCLYHLYSSNEIHPPTVAGFHTTYPLQVDSSRNGLIKTPKTMPIQMEEAKKYVDIQFDYYYKMLQGNISLVFFSDHSFIGYDLNNKEPYFMKYKEPALVTHVPLLIVDSHYKKDKINSFFSLIDFNNIMISLINRQELEIPTRNIIRYQFYPIYNKMFRNYAYDNGFEKYVNGMDCFLSNEYIYIQLSNGDYEVYKISDTSTNISETDEGKKFIEAVRAEYNVVTDEFLSFLNYTE